MLHSKLSHIANFLFSNVALAAIYRPEVIRNAINWARKRKLHTIVDEIYALSATQGFQSVCFFLWTLFCPIDLHFLVYLTPLTRFTSEGASGPWWKAGG